MITNPQSIDDIKANREEWAMALESGDYKQTRHELRNADKYCCLGVLCNLYDQSGWNEEDTGFHWNEASAENFPPNRVLNSVGLLPTWGGNPSTDHRNPLHPRVYASANDDGATFSEIAQMIRNAPLPEVAAQ